MDNGIMKGIIYEKPDDNNSRYALGVKGKNTLMFFGVNPSTATPEDYDQTMKRAKSFALDNGYDSWIMFNIYPQRATNPDHLDCKCNETFHKENITVIKKLIKNNATIVAAWGNLIKKRRYLICCLDTIVKELKNKQIIWKHIGSFTTKNNPRHLSRLENAEKLHSFDVKNYMEKKIRVNSR